MSDFTYPEVGATLEGPPLPDGYALLGHRTPLGIGPEAFAAAGEAVLSWRLHRAAGVAVLNSRSSTTAERAAPGVRVRVLLGVGRVGLTAPCEVVWALEEPTRIGFGYGTLDGHPERGEESFLVELADDGAVWFTVTAFSRPAAWYTRAAGPLVPLFQHLYARRLGQVLRRIAGQAERK
jgi:uncharacterized protein (UPF0548 family)